MDHICCASGEGSATESSTSGSSYGASSQPPAGSPRPRRVRVKRQALAKTEAEQYRAAMQELQLQVYWYRHWADHYWQQLQKLCPLCAVPGQTCTVHAPGACCSGRPCDPSAAEPPRAATPAKARVRSPSFGPATPPAAEQLRFPLQATVAAAGAARPSPASVSGAAQAVPVAAQAPRAGAAVADSPAQPRKRAASCPLV